MYVAHAKDQNTGSGFTFFDTKTATSLQEDDPIFESYEEYSFRSSSEAVNDILIKVFLGDYHRRKDII